MKLLRRLAAALVLILVLGAGLGVSLLAWLGRPAEGIGAEGILYTLEAGQTAGIAAAGLEESGALRSALVFRILAKLGGQETELKRGSYRIEAGMSAGDILALLVSGEQVLERVTIPEGSTLSATARIFERSGICPAADFIAASRDPSLLAELGLPGSDAEGWLFPDTYFMPRGFAARDVVRSLVRGMREKIASLPEAAGLSQDELSERVILASIIEREYRVADEAPLIAGVFDNRLRIGMALQSCATVAYVITERLGKPHPSVIYDRDLKLPDPYNTYAHAGLPPGPICSPGLTALRAAFSPTPSAFLYFRLVDEAEGRHIFSTSLEQHVRAGSLFTKRTAGQ
jgi:UPF0755 protein